MLTTLILCLAAAPLPTEAMPASAAVASASVVQDPPVPDKRPEIEKMLDEFKAHIDKRGTEDRDAIEVIDKLLPEYKSCGPKDKAAIVKELAKSFDQKRTDEKEGVPNVNLYIAAATALGEMGPESTKPLISAIDNKNLKKLPAVKSKLIHSLGKTKDVKEGLDTLIHLLDDKDATLVNAAGDALGEYASADQATRKKAFESMLKILTAAFDTMNGNVNDNTAKERYDTISPAIITSLGKLAKYEERSPDKWRDWWNKNKAKNWDDTK
jgi:HEAT repeat protein